MISCMVLLVTPEMLIDSRDVNGPTQQDTLKVRKIWVSEPWCLGALEVSMS